MKRPHREWANPSIERHPPHWTHPAGTPAPLSPLPAPARLAPLKPWKMLPKDVQKQVRKRLRGSTVIGIVTNLRGGTCGGTCSAEVTYKGNDGETKTETFIWETVG